MMLQIFQCAWGLQKFPWLSSSLANCIGKLVEIVSFIFPDCCKILFSKLPSYNAPSNLLVVQLTSSMILWWEIRAQPEKSIKRLCKEIAKVWVLLWYDGEL